MTSVIIYYLKYVIGGWDFVCCFRGISARQPTIHKCTKYTELFCCHNGKKSLACNLSKIRPLRGTFHFQVQSKVDQARNGQLKVYFKIFHCAFRLPKFNYTFFISSKFKTNLSVNCSDFIFLLFSLFLNLRFKHHLRIRSELLSILYNIIHFYVDSNKRALYYMIIIFSRIKYKIIMIWCQYTSSKRRRKGTHKQATRIIKTKSILFGSWCKSFIHIVFIFMQQKKKNINNK